MNGCLGFVFSPVYYTTMTTKKKNLWIKNKKNFFSLNPPLNLSMPVYEIFHNHDPSFKKVTNLISRSSAICKGQVTRSYITNHATKDCNVLIAAYEPHETRQGTRMEIVGFALMMNDKDNNYVYLDVICAKHSGRGLMDRVVENTESLGKNRIRISAIPQALPYWLKSGFALGTTGTWRDVGLSLKKQSVEMSKLPASQAPVYYNNAQYMNYLRRLVKANLGSDGYRTLEECNVHGYIMTLNTQLWKSEKSLFRLPTGKTAYRATVGRTAQRTPIQSIKRKPITRSKPKKLVKNTITTRQTRSQTNKYNLRSRKK